MALVLMNRPIIVSTLDSLAGPAGHRHTERHIATTGECRRQPPPFEQADATGAGAASAAPRWLSRLGRLAPEILAAQEQVGECRDNRVAAAQPLRWSAHCAASRLIAAGQPADVVAIRAAALPARGDVTTSPGYKASSWRRTAATTIRRVVRDDDQMPTFAPRVRSMSRNRWSAADVEARRRSSAASARPHCGRARDASYLGTDGIICTGRRSRVGSSPAG